MKRMLVILVALGAFVLGSSLINLNAKTEIGEYSGIIASSIFVAGFINYKGKRQQMIDLENNINNLVFYYIGILVVALLLLITLVVLLIKKYKKSDKAKLVALYQNKKIDK